MVNYRLKLVRNYLLARAGLFLVAYPVFLTVYFSCNATSVGAEEQYVIMCFIVII